MRADLYIYLPNVVDPVGFEPTTSSMPLRRAPNCAMGPIELVYSTRFIPPRQPEWTWRDSNPRPHQCD